MPLIGEMLMFVYIVTNLTVKIYSILIPISNSTLYPLFGTKAVYGIQTGQELSIHQAQIHNTRIL